MLRFEGLRHFGIVHHGCRDRAARETAKSNRVPDSALGLRWANAAVNAPDETTYETDMTNARNMLTPALSAIQNLQSSVASSQATVTQTQTLQNQDITDLTNQIDNIQQVDINSVGVKLNLLQTQLQASYSATAKLTQLSILNYLS